MQAGQSDAHDTIWQRDLKMWNSFLAFVFLIRNEFIIELGSLINEGWNVFWDQCVPIDTRLFNSDDIHYSNQYQLFTHKKLNITKQLI